jgi:uncharacterized protein (DUF952 family)
MLQALATDRTIYHVATAADLLAAEKAGCYAGSALCRRDGFIHMSTAAQLAPTLARFFAGRDDVVLLALDAAELGNALRWEEVPGVGVFPHYYGAFAAGQYRVLGAIPRDGDGVHRLTALIAGAEGAK